MDSLEFGSLKMKGLKIIQSAYLEEDGEPVKVRRTWRQRLCSRPWRPWQTSYVVIPRIPYRGVYLIGNNTVVVHPENYQTLLYEQARHSGRV